MNVEKMKLCLETILEGQKRIGGEAPVTLSIGAVRDGHCEHDEIIIYDCPTRTIERLQDQGFSVSMDSQVKGLCVDFY